MSVLRAISSLKVSTCSRFYPNVFARVVTHEPPRGSSLLFRSSSRSALFPLVSSLPPPPLAISATSRCETELLVKGSRVPFFWTRAGKSARSSLARDTLQLATFIMLAGIFEGNNVRERSLAVGSSVACVLHFLSCQYMHAVVKGRVLVIVSVEKRSKIDVRH